MTLLDRMSGSRSSRSLLVRIPGRRNRSLTADHIKAVRKRSIRNRTPLDRVTRSLRAQIQAVRRKLIFHRKTAPLRRKMAENRRKGRRAMITAAGTPTTNRKKRGITAEGSSVSIRTGSGRKLLILNMISRQRTMLLQKAISLQREKKQSFMAAKSWISYRRKRRKPEERRRQQERSCQRKRSIPLSVSLMKRRAGQSMCLPL